MVFFVTCNFPLFPTQLRLIFPLGRKERKKGGREDGRAQLERRQYGKVPGGSVLGGTSACAVRGGVSPGLTCFSLPLALPSQTHHHGGLFYESGKIPYGQAYLQVGGGELYVYLPWPLYPHLASQPSGKQRHTWQ